MKRSSIITGQTGGVLVLTALFLFIFLGLAALAIDVGHLMVVRNELRNAADAGALAGAGVLYTSNAAGDDLVVNTDSNLVAAATTTANVSDAAAAEVITIERGHWCFNNCSGGATGVFTPNSSTAVSLGSLDGLSFAEADANTNYINAVRVVAGRGPAIQAASFFARIFGPEFSGFSLTAESVAYLGFTGESFPVDFPIAICRESILGPGNNFTCSRGRMINSSGSGYSTETGGWTNLQQANTCGGAASASQVTQLIAAGCAGTISDNIVSTGVPMTTSGGQIQSAYTPFFNCWQSKAALDSNGDGIPDRPWHMTLPLIECDGKNPGPCNTVIGAINLDILWITNQNDPHFNRIPTYYSYSDSEMSVNYTCPATCTPTAAQPVCASLATEAGRQLCWANFLTANNVVDENGQPFTAAGAANGYLQKNIFFKPSCSLATAGGPGGPGGNSLSKIPVLVR